MDIKYLNKEFLVEFIEAYRSFSCLWRIKSSEYKERNKKNKAYEQLLNKYKTVDSTATLQTVKTKIDSLRGSFRKEIKKMKETQRSGAGEDEIYKPRLWYYDHLLFLLDQETPRKSISSLDTEDYSENVTKDVMPDEEVISPRSEHSAISNESMSIQSTSTLHSTPIASPSSVSKSNTTKTVRRNQKRKADEVFEKVTQQLEYAREDSFDTIGRNLANKLRELPHDIAVITEKLISDIVFEAQMGNVTRHTKAMLHDNSNNAMNKNYTSSIPECVQNIQSTELSQQKSPPQHNILSTSQNVQSQQTVLDKSRKRSRILHNI